MNLPRKVRSLALLVSAAGLIAGLAGPAGAAPGSVDPSTAPRGADPAVPVFDERTDTLRYDGKSVTLPVVGDPFRVTRAAGDRFVVNSAVGARGVLASYDAVTRDRERLARNAYESEVSANGRKVAYVRQGKGYSVVVVKEVTGELVSRVRFAGYADVVLFSRRVLFNVTDLHGGTRLLAWSPGRRPVRVLAEGMHATGGDWGANRLVLLRETRSFDYCARVVELRSPEDVVWRSCRWLPVAWSPDGSRVLAYPVMTDGYSIGELAILDARTREPLARFRGSFHSYVWEDADSVLAVTDNFDTNSAAVMRLNLDGTVQRASDVFVPDEMLPTHNVPLVVAGR